MQRSGISTSVLKEYRKLILQSDSNSLPESINELFTTDLSSYLNYINHIPTLVVNSREERKIFRSNAELIRRKWYIEKSLYLK